MIYLDATDKKLEAELAAVSSVNPVAVVCFHDVIRQTRADFSEPLGAMSVASLSAGADITIISAPALNGTVRYVDSIYVYNNNEAAITVRVKLDFSAGEATLVNQSLDAANTLIYLRDSGWSVLA